MEEKLAIITETDLLSDKSEKHKIFKCETCAHDKKYNPKNDECEHLDNWIVMDSPNYIKEKWDLEFAIENCEHYESDENIYCNFPQDENLELFNKIVEFLKVNVEFSDVRQYYVCSAWILANWLPEKWQVYPYLYFFGLSESGKNRAWESISALSYKPQSATNITSSALFRCVRPPIYDEEIIKKNGRNYTKKVIVDYDYSTLFLDELQPITDKSSTNEQDLHTILNCGYKKGGNVKRCVGENFEIIDFHCDGFKSIASINPIPDALRSRCIMIQMVKSNRRFPIRLIQTEIEHLRIDLEIWKNKAEKMPIENRLDDVIESKLFDVSKNNGRLVELYYPLYRVTPLAFKAQILDYLKTEADKKIETALASWECEIFKAVVDVFNKDVLILWVSTEAVTKEYNEQHISQMPMSTKRMAEKIEELGFSPHRTMKARGFEIDLKLIEKLKNRFQLPT